MSAAKYYWYVNGHKYDVLLYACEDAMYEHTAVTDEDGKVVADYSNTPPVTMRKS